MTEEKHDIQARKVTERVSDTLSGFTSIFSGPLSAVKDLARPAYWIPDEEIVRQARVSMTDSAEESLQRRGT